MDNAKVHVDFLGISAERRLTDWSDSIIQLRKSLIDKRGTPHIGIILVIKLPDGLDFNFRLQDDTIGPTLKTNRDNFILNYPLDANSIDYYKPCKAKISNQHIQISPQYTNQYTVSNFIRIMIQQQIRFSTLEDSLTNQNYAICGRENLQWLDYFNFFYENFKAQGKLYNHWEDLGYRPVKIKLQLLNNTKIFVNSLVPWVDLDFNYFLDDCYQYSKQVWNKGIDGLRRRVLDARKINGESHITVRVNLPFGVKFQYVGSNQEMYTNPNNNQSFLTYQLSINNLYPSDLKIERRPIKFEQVYNRSYSVSNFTGIMIAEQVRFSTLRDAIKDPKELFKFYDVPVDWRRIFNYFYDNFKSPNGKSIYNEWRKNYQNAYVEQQLLNRNQVRIQMMVPWRQGP